MMLYWRFAWRELKQRPSRPILTLLSVVIGVAAVVAVTIASGTTKRAFDDIYKTVAGNATLEVTAGTGNSFDEKVVDKVRQTPGVKFVAPLMKRDTSLSIQEEGKKERHYRLKVMGVDPKVDREIHDYEITAGKPLEEQPGILADANFAKSQHLQVGDHVDIMTPSGFQGSEITGLFSSKGTAASSEGATIYTTLFATQTFWHSPGKIDTAQIVTDEKANVDDVKKAIAAVLPKGVEVQPPAARSSMAEETSLSTEQGMRMARGFSLLVAVFIITNTFLINVQQRRRQIGIMRAIGATRAQIAEMVYREAIMMGVLGTILGSLLGILGAHYLSVAMGSLYKATLPPIELTAYPFIVGAACGLGISLVAAALPARKATHLSPLEAMRDVLPEEIEGVQWSLVGLGGAIVAVCIAVMTASILGWVSMVHTVWAAILLLVGLVLLLPIALGPLSAITGFFIKMFMPIEGRLARRQLLRHRARTTLTVGVVFIAAATGIGLANSVTDTVNDVREWYRKTIVADFFVRASAPDMASNTSADLPDDVGAQIRKIQGIESIEAMRLRTVKVHGQTASLIARDHTKPGPPDLDVMSGSENDLKERFQNGEVAIGSVLAQRTKLKVGDDLVFETENGDKKFRIAAIVNDYQAGGLTIHMERSVARDQLDYTGVSAYVIKADHKQLAEIRKDLQAICDDYGLMLQTFTDIQHTIDVMMSGVVAALWAMVVLGLMVSAVGVTNTLTINVLEQTRELGLLRIVAMTRDQVRKTILTQAVIMAVMALIPGIIAGVSVAWLINVAMMPVIGHPVQFELHPNLLFGGFAVGLVIIAFAAWFPANRAAKLDLLEAVRTL